MIFEKSMVDVAYDYISEQNKPVEFAEVWSYVVATLNMSEEDRVKLISVFYTNLSVDERFHNDGNNVWCLRSSLTFKEAAADAISIQEMEAPQAKSKKEELDEEEVDDATDSDYDGAEDYDGDSESEDDEEVEEDEDEELDEEDSYDDDEE